MKQKHEFRKSSPRGPLDPKRLKSFEKELGTTLPEPYRTFLIKRNGCQFGSEEMPTTFFGLHDRKHSSLDGPTYPNREFLPPQVLVIGHDYGSTVWLIGISGKHRGKAFRGRGGSDWESASQGGNVWENVSVAAPDFPALLDLIAADTALEEGDIDRFDAYLADGHDVNEPILGRVPIEIALANDHFDFARSLLERGADISKVDDMLFRDVGATGSFEALLFYADAMKDINHRITHEKWTLLDLAVWQERDDVAQALLDRGARPNAETLRLARTCGKQMVALLKRYTQSGDGRKRTRHTE